MTFAKFLNEAHRITGNTRENEIPDPVLFYRVTCETPQGCLEEQENCVWRYLCDHPSDGWLTEYLVLANWLTADPMETLYVGAGSGRIVKWLLSKGMDAIGIDLSDDAIELMERRGVPCEKMDGAAMTYADNAWDRVVVHSDGVLDSVADVVPLLAEAARVSSSRVIVTGYEIDEAETVDFQWGFTWQGGGEAPRSYYSHPAAVIVAALEALGMSPVTCTKWGEPGTGSGGSIFGVQYLIEAKW